MMALTMWKRRITVCSMTQDAKRDGASDSQENAGSPETPEQELALLRRYWEVTQASDARAIERWRAANPGKENVIPDRTNLVVFLMGELEKRDLCAMCSQRGARVSRYLGRPLCLQHYRELSQQMAREFADARCSQCGEQGIVHIGAEKQGFCAAHEPPEAQARRNQERAQDLYDTLMQHVVHPGEEIATLLALAVDIAVMYGEPRENLVGTVETMYARSLEQHTRRGAWASGFRAFVEGGSAAPSQPLARHGYLTAQKMKMQEAPEEERARATVPGFAESLYDEVAYQEWAQKGGGEASV